MTERPPTLPEAAEQLHTALRVYAAAYVAALAPGIRALGEMAARIRAAEQARDRAPHHSPYGPPPRRTH
ncbi:hypothetical protein [Streptomyces nigra]|uniref:hypothetical protein n=1 Tax=Streptomyces nigra TaxID=1827580 RepID=UPI0038004A1D